MFCPCHNSVFGNDKSEKHSMRPTLAFMTITPYGEMMVNILSDKIPHLKQWWYLSIQQPLTYWSRDKMVVIFHTTFQMHFLEWKCIKFYQYFVEVCTKVSINNIPGDKPFYQPMMVSLMTHICINRSQWVNFCFRSKKAHERGINWWHLMGWYTETGANSDLSNMAELPSFWPPASESTLQYRTSPLRQARMRPKFKAAPAYI